jgi:hypothetical protein
VIAGHIRSNGAGSRHLVHGVVMNSERFIEALKVINVPVDGRVRLHLRNGEHSFGKLNPLMTGLGLVSIESDDALSAVDVQDIIAVSSA